MKELTKPTQTLKKKIKEVMDAKDTEDKRDLIKNFDEHEKASLLNQYDEHIENYKFYLKLALQVNGFFYAILGGILLSYFAKSLPLTGWAALFFLLIPILIGIILTITFFGGAIQCSRVTKEYHVIAEVCDLVIVHKVENLTYLLIAFGSIFFLAASLLIWLWIAMSSKTI